MAFPLTLSARPLLAAALLAVSSTAMSANLLTNGSFELLDTAAPGVFGAPHGHSATFGSTGITGWNIIGQTSGNIDIVVNPIWINQDGVRGLDLEGSPGTMGVSQSFATSIGSTYLVSYWMAGNVGGNNAIKTMKVDVAGNASLYSANAQFDITGKSYGAMGWRNDTFQFVADSTTTLLSFLSTEGSGFFGPALDNVSVDLVSPTTVVPVPAALPLMIGGLGAIGWAARRRRS